jgi:hypothetical protein
MLNTGKTGAVFQMMTLLFFLQDCSNKTIGIGLMYFRSSSFLSKVRSQMSNILVVPFKN